MTTSYLHYATSAVLAIAAPPLVIRAAEAQERFFPYLVGYVALYADDLPAAERALTEATNMGGNQRDPFMHCLLAMTHERMGRQEEAKAMYQKASDLATAHNPPAAFGRRFVRQKLGLP
ncbi:MAG: hypothetical protein HYW52_02865 [Gemmatimonadetes bacterium]|nr:hypothetical protein [Gemmatimonadota bacterium]